MNGQMDNTESISRVFFGLGIIFIIYSSYRELSKIKQNSRKEILDTFYEFKTFSFDKENLQPKFRRRQAIANNVELA